MAFPIPVAQPSRVTCQAIWEYRQENLKALVTAAAGDLASRVSPEALASSPDWRALCAGTQRAGAASLGDLPIELLRNDDHIVVAIPVAADALAAEAARLGHPMHDAARSAAAAQSGNFGLAELALQFAAGQRALQGDAHRRRQTSARGAGDPAEQVGPVRFGDRDHSSVKVVLQPDGLKALPSKAAPDALAELEALFTPVFVQALAEAVAAADASAEEVACFESAAWCVTAAPRSSATLSRSMRVLLGR